MFSGKLRKVFFHSSRFTSAKVKYDLDFGESQKSETPVAMLIPIPVNKTLDFRVQYKPVMSKGKSGVQSGSTYYSQEATHETARQQQNLRLAISQQVEGITARYAEESFALEAVNDELQATDVDAQLGPEAVVVTPLVGTGLKSHLNSAIYIHLGKDTIYLEPGVSSFDGNEPKTNPSPSSKAMRGSAFA